jgi:hypothetical protein
MSVWKEPTTVTIRRVNGRWLIFNSKGVRVDSKALFKDADKAAKRLFPDSKIVVD